MFFDKFKKISVPEAKSLIEEKNATLLDLRKAEDYQASHIEGARSIQNKEINDFIKERDNSAYVICYCYIGYSSKNACRKLTKAGFENVYNLNGGYAAWQMMAR